MLWLLDISKVKQLLFFLLFFGIMGGTSYAQHHLKRACVQSNFNDIQLSWDLTQDPCGQFIEIELFARPNDFSPFVSIAVITNFNQNTYTHVGAAALGSTWSYQLIYRFQCNGLAFAGDTLYLDLAQPVPSTFDSVSYDPVSNGIFLGWSQNPALDLHGYYLWENENNNNFKFDSTYGQLSYLDQRNDPNSGQFFYALTAFDSCANQSVISTKHASPYLSGSSSSCGSKATLNWTPYVGHGSVYYDVYLSYNGTDYFIDTRLGANATSYQITLNSGDIVTAFVRCGLTNGYSSRSNPVEFQALDSFPVSSNYLRSVSWVAPNAFEIDSYYDQSIDFDSLYLLRLTETNPVYLWQDLTTENPFPYLLQTTNDTTIYTFQQILVDRCGRRYYSNAAFNVVLKGTTTVNPDEYSLIWNQPEYFDGGISSYSINLGDNIGIYSTWNSIHNNLSDTQHIVLVNNDTLNLRCFQTVAFENDPNQFGTGSIVYSNPVCFVQEPSIYFPNAIVVHGINNEFKPVGLSINKEKSTIQIFAKNGQLVYKNNLNTYWNGLLPNGDGYHTEAFLYIADIHFLNGQREHYSGTVTVIY